MIYLRYFIIVIIGLAAGFVLCPEEPLAVFVFIMFIMIVDIWFKAHENDTH
jgi:hypothetical protein